MNNLGAVYERQGRFDKAEPLFEESVAILRQTTNLTDPVLLAALLALVRAYQAGDKYDKAEPLLVDSVAAVRGQFGDDHPLAAGLRAQLGLNHLKRRQYAAAEPALRDCLAFREKKQPDDWLTFNTRSMLGEALLGQQKYTDAEPLLKEGYEGIKHAQNKIPAEVASSVSSSRSSG